MIRGLLLVFGLVAATFLAHFFMADAGYALINFRGYAIETSVLGLGLFAVLAYILVRVVARVFRSFFDLGRGVGQYQKKQARKKLSKGLIELVEGNYARGERLLAESAHNSDTPMLNYLNAARAAQEQGANDRRDNWLMMAYENDPEGGRAVLLTQAELQIADGEHERALATLRKLEDQSPGHPQGLALMAQLYEQLGEWESLRELLPTLRKRKALPAAELDALARRAWGRLLANDGDQGDFFSLQRHWQEVPKPLRSDPALFRDYVRAMIRSGDPAIAEQTIRKALKSGWDSELARLYGDLEGADNALLLGNVRGWLKKHPEDALLLLTAGRLAFRAGEHEAAKDYIESSLRLAPSAEGYETKGALLTELGELDDAAGAFRKGLALATGRHDTTLPVVTGT